MSTKDVDHELLKDVEAFLTRHDMHPTTFGLEVLNDGKLVAQIKEGRDLRTSTVRKIRKYIAEFRPVERPRRRAQLQPAA